jgi:hypothetical protein
MSGGKASCLCNLGGAEGETALDGTTARTSQEKPDEMTVIFDSSLTRQTVGYNYGFALHRHTSVILLLPMIWDVV